jgi:tetratricopeptide (TPR) repeat protein
MRDSQDRSQRRLSVLVDDTLIEGASEAEQRQARVSATQWLALPWELPNLVAALVWHYQAARAEVVASVPGQAEATPAFEAVVHMATMLESLLQYLGRPRALADVARVRADAAQRLGAWSYARFEAERAAVERLHEAGRPADAVTAAQTLLGRAHAAGPEAYVGAAYHLAAGHWLLGRMLAASGNAEAALALLAEAHTRFAHLAEAGSTSAARMASVCGHESGGCLMALGRLDAAAVAYETALRLDGQRHDLRAVATGKFQLGSVRLLQGDYAVALTAFTEARDTFAHMGEPVSVAAAWHQIGMVHQKTGQYAAAEDAYQKSLQMKTQMGNTAGQASTLIQLGLLYEAMGRLEDAVRFSLQAAERYAALGNSAYEGRAHHNAAIQLIALRHYDDARRELQRAIVCKESLGHEAESW